MDGSLGGVRGEPDRRFLRAGEGLRGASIRNRLRRAARGHAWRKIPPGTHSQYRTAGIGGDAIFAAPFATARGNAETLAAASVTERLAQAGTILTAPDICSMHMC